jgi:hypothetical protein
MLLAAGIVLLGAVPISENWLVALPATVIAATVPTFWLLYKSAQRHLILSWARRDDDPQE